MLDLTNLSLTSDEVPFHALPLGGTANLSAYPDARCVDFLNGGPDPTPRYLKLCEVRQGNCAFPGDRPESDHGLKAVIGDVQAYECLSGC